MSIASLLRRGILLSRLRFLGTGIFLEAAGEATVAFLKKGHGRGIKEMEMKGKVLSSVDEDEVKKAFKGVKVKDVWGAKGSDTSGGL